jgi:hypothetical protein
MKRAESMADDGEVPPAVTCPICRRGECSGCEAAAAATKVVALTWEKASGCWLHRLFDTALATSVEPERTFGELSDGSVRPAFVFAVVAEAFAIGSLALVAVLAFAAFAPDLALRTLLDPSARWLLLGVVALGIASMVGLHAIWGVCLELGARGSERGSRWAQGARFGLYACGWDLLTSPAGVLHGLASRGMRGAWPPIGRAIRAPRRATDAYLERCRKLDRAAQHRGKRFSLITLGAAFVVICVTAVFVFVHVLGLL